jgi:hypothetical protein
MSDTSANTRLRRNERIRFVIGMLLMAVGFVLLPVIFGGVAALLIFNWLAKAILRRCVADDERFFASWRGVLASSALTACFMVAPVFVLVMGVRAGARVPMHRESGACGDCATYECLAEFLGRSHEPSFEGVISQLPKDVRDVHYRFRPRAGLLELRFSLDGDEFIAWVESLGWTRDTIVANHRGGHAAVYGDESEEVPVTVVIAKGYQLDSYGSDNHHCRSVFYDEETHVVYLQLWIPFPEEVTNSLIANPSAD